MSMPNIPDINAEITIDRNNAIDLVLASIGMEELSLAHLMNAEAEKVQFVLGTLEELKQPYTIEEVMKTNDSVNAMLRDVIKNQMLLGMKMEDTVELANATEKTPDTPDGP